MLGQGDANLALLSTVNQLLDWMLIQRERASILSSCQFFQHLGQHVHG